MKNKLTKGDEKRLAAFLAKHQRDGASTLLETKESIQNNLNK